LVGNARHECGGDYLSDVGSVGILCDIGVVDIDIRAFGYDRIAQNARSKQLDNTQNFPFAVGLYDIARHAVGQFGGIGVDRSAIFHACNTVRPSIVLCRPCASAFDHRVVVDD
jgi:hypothetical protein